MWLNLPTFVPYPAQRGELPQGASAAPTAPAAAGGGGGDGGRDGGGGGGGGGGGARCDRLCQAGRLAQPSQRARALFRMRYVCSTSRIRLKELFNPYLLVP